MPKQSRKTVTPLLSLTLITNTNHQHTHTHTHNYLCLWFGFFLQFFSIALAHFSNHCLLFQNSSHTAHNRRWNNQNTIWCLQNDTTFSKLITHPSKPNISIKTYNLCSIENVCFLIYLTMDNKIETTAININLCNHHFVEHPHSIDCFTTDNILQFGFCTEHSNLGNILSESCWNLKICIQ